MQTFKKFSNKQLFGEPFVADLPLHEFNESSFNLSAGLSLDPTAPGFWLDPEPQPLPQLNSQTKYSGPSAAPAPTTSAPSPEDAFIAALKQVHTHEHLNKGIERCQRCSLYQNRQQAVIFRGALQAPLMVLGDYPTVTENKNGAPLMGPEGQLLNKMLQAIAQNPEQTFVSLLLKCQPSERTLAAPHTVFNFAEHFQTCLPYLQKQIELVQPKVILLLGELAAQLVLNFSGSLNTLRTQWHSPFILGSTTSSTRPPKIRVTYHPRDLLANPDLKRLAWNDLQEIKKELL